MAIPLLLFSIFALPLIINPGVFATFEETYLYPRLWWLYGISLPAALLVIFNWKGPWTDAKPFFYLLGITLGWQVLSVFVTGAGWDGWWGMPYRADGVLMHALYALFLLCGWRWRTQDTEWILTLAKVALLSGSLIALTNIAQQLHLAGVPNANAFSGIFATPMGGTLGNRGYLGGVMALFLPLTLWSWQILLGYSSDKNSQRWSRYLPQISLALVTWALLGSFTRGAWLAGFVGVLVWYFLSRPRHKRLYVPLLIGVTLFITSSTLFNNWRVFSFGSDQNSQALLDSSGRTVLWKSAVFGISHKPLFGWGTPALFQAMNSRPLNVVFEESGMPGKLVSSRLNRSFTEPPTFIVQESNGKRQKVSIPVDKVHNELLDYGLTYGIITSFIFIIIFLLGIWHSRTTAFGISGALVAYVVYLMTWPEVVRFAPIAWFLLGIALAGHMEKERPKFSLNTL